MSADYKPITVIRGLNVAPQMISDIANLWKHKLAEFETVIEGKDAQVVEGYSNFSKDSNAQRCEVLRSSDQ
jgi:hypothetical protein